MCVCVGGGGGRGGAVCSIHMSPDLFLLLLFYSGAEGYVRKRW